MTKSPPKARVNKHMSAVADAIWLPRWTNGRSSRPSGAKKLLRVVPRQMDTHDEQRMPFQQMNPSGEQRRRLKM